MDLYYSVKFDQLNYIIVDGLGIKLNETEMLPILLDVYPHWAKARQICKEKKLGLEQRNSDFVVLCINKTFLVSNFLEPVITKDGFISKYYYKKIINSSDISLIWADYIFLLNEFMFYYNQLQHSRITACRSEALVKCINWYSKSYNERKAILKLVNHCSIGYMDELSLITGFTDRQLLDLASHHNTTTEHVVIYEESYKKEKIAENDHPSR